MRNILVEIKYIGLNYSGFALQKNGLSIYGVLSSCLYKIFNQHIKINGCSRTDALVHANQYYFNFFVKSNLKNENIKNALNFYLPKDISCVSCKDVNNDFHARFSCVQKEYLYRLYNSNYRNPFFEKFSLHYTYSIDFDLINKACTKFIGEYDFKSFCSSGSSVVNTIRKIYYFTFEKDLKNENSYIFKISGNGFLYNMVRILIGTVLKVNERKIKLDDIEKIIISCDRKKSGPTVPAYALYLNKVEY